MSLSHGELQRFRSVNRNMDHRSSCDLCGSFVSTFPLRSGAREGRYHSSGQRQFESEHGFLLHRNSVSLPPCPVMIPLPYRRKNMTSCLGIYLWVLAVGYVVVTAPVSAHTAHHRPYYSTYLSNCPSSLSFACMEAHVLYTVTTSIAN
uniref:Uncharacterized protein n=1 Tax=Letharia vulpina TaxID=129387 RepID=A0A7G3WA09_LETVU|nr:hypothetical protein [Letharia vulpina]